MSTTEKCPNCGQPADALVLYHLLDEEKDMAMGFGCSNCGMLSAPKPLFGPEKTVLGQMLENLAKKLKKEE